MLPTHERFPNVRKIAVLRANALGDFIFTLPALVALRAAYPEAEIVLLALGWHATFLAGRPGPVDRVVVVPPMAGLTVPQDARDSDDSDEQEHFFAAMRQEHFDLALQMHGGGRYSNPCVLRLGARFTVGSKTPDAPPLDRWIPYIFYQNEIMRHLEVVALAGAAPVVLEPRLIVTDRDRTEALSVVPETDQPLVALHPGAGDSRRHWPPEKFAAVGDALAADGAQIVVTGIKAERGIISNVLRAMNAATLDLCGKLSLGGLAGLFECCHLVIANDTGPLHLASAVGAGSVGIYWCGNQITFGHITRARHRPILSWRLNCPVCGRNCICETCDHRESFVADVPIEEVLAAARNLLLGPIDEQQ